MRKRSAPGRAAPLACGLFFFCATAGCGHSEEEWNQQLREGEALRGQLKAQERAAASCDAEQQAARAELEELKRRLIERGVDLRDASASLEVQRQALHEYSARVEQLGRRSRQMEALRAELQTTTNPGLSVDVRDNRLVIRVPGDSLFVAGQDALSEGGKAMLTRIAAALARDPELVESEFQVGAHTDDKSPKGRAGKDDWSATVASARAAVAYLVSAKAAGGPGLNPAHWSAAGYGSSKPLADNATEAGRTANRRLEFVVIPSVGETLNLNGLAR